jgi:hypothetical protein
VLLICFPCHIVAAECVSVLFGTCIVAAVICIVSVCELVFLFFGFCQQRSLHVAGQLQQAFSQFGYGTGAADQLLLAAMRCIQFEYGVRTVGVVAVRAEPWPSCRDMKC